MDVNNVIQRSEQTVKVLQTSSPFLIRNGILITCIITISIGVFLLFVKYQVKESIALNNVEIYNSEFNPNHIKISGTIEIDIDPICLVGQDGAVSLKSQYYNYSFDGVVTHVQATQGLEKNIVFEINKNINTSEFIANKKGQYSLNVSFKKQSFLKVILKSLCY